MTPTARRKPIPATLPTAFHAMTATLPQAIWRLPDAWTNQRVFCTWEQLSEIATKLRAAGIDAFNYDAEQYLLLGDSTRGVPRGWYHCPTYCNADGRTLWREHCVMVDSDMQVIKESSRTEPKPPFVTDAAERALLMRCLRDA
jgi:hypothetical protein